MVSNTTVRSVSGPMSEDAAGCAGRSIRHVLVPLDGSPLAECVLPHVAAIAPVTNARVTLLHVLQQPHNGRENSIVDPVEWHLQKQKAEKYFEEIANRLGEAGVLGVEPLIL